jgi:hypothetical protein
MIGVIDILRTDANVAARIGGAGNSARVYPMERKQGSTLPALTVEVTDIEPSDTKSGVSRLDEEFTTVTSYADTHEACRLLAVDCRTALDRASGTHSGEVIQSVQFLSLLTDKELINNKKVYFIEQNFKVRVLK